VYRLWAEAIVRHAAGLASEADETLRLLVERHAREWAFQVAEVYAARGDANAAFEWLERAYAERDAGLAYLKPDPLLRSLHADPRWGALLRRMGFDA